MNRQRKKVVGVARAPVLVLLLAHIDQLLSFVRSVVMFERGHGRPKQEITGPDDGPVQVE
jgi:hypothetical protein